MAKKPTAAKPAAPAPAAASAPAINFEHLKFVVNATASAAGFGYMPPEAATALEAAGVAEVDRVNIDGAGNVATRATATAAGILAAHEAAQGATTAQAPAAAPAPAAQPAANDPASAFTIVTGFELPKAREFGPRTSKYPFDALAIGQAFFVPGAVASKMSSTVNSAGNRYPQDPVNGRKFVCRNLADGVAFKHPGVSGVVVARVAWEPKRPYTPRAAAAPAPAAAPAAPGAAPAFPG